MSTRNICNICGANYEYRDGKWRCPACGAYKPEELSNEEETLLYNAAQKLRLSAFDDAEELYRDITVQYPKNSRGYWGLVLAKYGIKYEKDYDGKMIPSCYATSYEGVKDDNNYKKALDLADKDNKKYYQDQAEKIDKVRSEWIEIADHEEPYDVFISYKDSDKENGTERTQDSYDAGELYSFLKDKGYRVFFSRESLRGKEGEKYEPFIFNALNTAQVMIVYGTKPEYIESTWVKNEWMRYYKRILRGEKQKNSLILAYKGFNPSGLTKPLSGIQGFDMGRAAIGFGDIEVKVADIINSAYKSQKIKRRTVKARKAKAAEKLKRVETVEVGKVAAKGRISRENINRRSIGGKEYKLSASAEKNLNIADKYLAQGIFDEAEKWYNGILQGSPRNGRALVGKLLVVTQSTDLTDFENGGAGRLREVSLIDNVLACAEKESAEKILSALCREVACCFLSDNIQRAKQIVSAIKDYDSPAVADMRVGLLDSGLNILGKDSDSAKYFIDIYLTFEEEDKKYVNGLHKAAQRAISNGDFDTAGYYLNTLKSVDPSSFDTQICLIEAEYKVKTVDEVVNRIESERAYGRAEMIVALLDKPSAEKWLGICLDEAEYLIDDERFVGAQRWIEVSAKYNFDSKEEKLKTLLEKCIRRASEKSAECFESILNFVADGNDNVYVKNAMNFAETARSNGSFSCAKSIYGKIMAVLPDCIPAVYGRFYADIGCASERGLTEKIGNITDWTCFEDVLSVQTEDADDLFWIKRLASACIDNVKKYKKSSNKAVFGVFEKLLSYIPEKSNDEMLALLADMAAFCVEDGLFVEAARYYGMYISEDPDCAAAHWGALLAKLRCSNEEELARQPVPIGDEEEFKAAQVCAAENEDLLNHYITVHGRQMNIIKAAQKRRRIIRISAIASACVVVAGAALGGWFTYYNSQNRLIYNLTDEGYTVSAGKFYKAESLVIPDEYEGRAVVAVADNAFSGHGEIESVVLPESLTSIGDGAFSGCTNLSSVSVAEQSVRTAAEYYADGGELEYVGDGAFDGCAVLEEFSFEYGLEYIGDRAFAGTAFTQVSLPATVEYVGGEAFSGCERLNSIIVGDRDEVPVSWAENWRDGCNASVDFRLRVVFDYNGATDGDYIAESYVSYNGEFDFVVPERRGYAFDGWFPGDTRLTDAKGASLSAWQFNDGGIITAHWAPNINSVVFNANGGEGDMPAQKIATDESAQLSANTFTRKGYTFAGWAENATGSVVYADGAEYAMGAESSYELFAVWSANRNKVVFDGNGATSGGTDTQYIYTGSSASLTDNGFKRDGYDFVGWSTALDGRVEYSDGQNYIMGTESSYTLYAVWEPHEYSIDYQLNGGSVNGINPVIYSIESDDIILLVPTRAGYTFIGWTGTDIAEPQLSVIIPKGSFGNRTYTAVWSANTNKVYFNANGGEGEMSAQEIKTDITAPLTANVFTRAGYAFAGWAIERNGDVVYADKANYTMGTAGEYTLYAVWSVIEYTISYDLGGGRLEGVNPAVYTVESAFALTNPVRAGYTFAGWTGTGLEKPLLFVSVVQGNVGNREYKAVWEAKTNKVIFHANGGAGEMPAQGIKTDEATALSANLFTRSGYSFIGWATSENGEVAFANCANYTMGADSEYHLYAVWTPNLNEVCFDGNGADGGEMEPLSVYTDSSEILPENEFTRTGYTFLGWATESGGGVVYEDGATYSMGVQSSYTLYAVWEANKYIVTLENDNGQEAIEVTFIFGEKYTIKVPEKQGYDFMGYYDNEGIQYTDKNGNSLAIWSDTCELTLYAKYTPRLNVVMFNGNGGSGEMTNITGYSDSKVRLPKNKFKFEGHEFVGWSNTLDGEVLYFDCDLYGVGTDSSYILYAIWKDFSDYIPISTTEDLKNIKNDLSGKYYLTCDINMAGEQWSSIGTMETPFNGELDGNGHVIYNLNQIDNSRIYYHFEHSANASITNYYAVGLFGVNSGVIRNLTLLNVSLNITCDGYETGIYRYSYYGGALCGRNIGMIEDCYIQGTIHAIGNVSNNKYIGGVAGYLQSDGIIKNTLVHVSFDTQTTSGLNIGTVAYCAKNDLIVNSGDNVASVWANSAYVHYMISEGIDIYQKINGHSEVTLYHNVYDKIGYTFLGWALSDGGEKIYDAEDRVVLEQGQTQITLYSVWTPHEIIFDSNGGSGTMSNLIVEPNANIDVPVCKFNPPEGMYFVGWAISADGEAIYFVGQQVSMPDENIFTVTLYAVWAAIE